MEDKLALALQTWHAELERILGASEPEAQAVGGRSRRRFYFRLENCMNVDQDTGNVRFMKLPPHTIINVPLVSTVVAQVPLNKENNSYEIELLNKPDIDSGLMLGLADRTFNVGHQVGHRKKSVGLRLSDLTIWREKQQEMKADVKKEFVVGDRIGCKVEEKDGVMKVVFTHNGNNISEGIVCEGWAPDSSVGWFPAVTIMAQQNQSNPPDNIKLITESTWRSKRPIVVKVRDMMKINKGTGQLMYRSTAKKDGEKKARSCSVVAPAPFSNQFAFFEVEAIALNKGDEICVGAVDADHPLNHLPGSVARSSIGYRGCAAAVCVGNGVKGSKKTVRAPQLSVGDKIGCGMEQRQGGVWALYFTHNSETFHEVAVQNRHTLHPAIGLKSSGGSAVCVCIQDVTQWLEAVGLEEDEDSKASQVDMKTCVTSEPAEIKVNKESARASFQSELGVPSDALLIASQPFTNESNNFEIEIAYGAHITVGVVSGSFEKKTHPGFSEESIGYNIGEGLVYINGSVSNDSDQKKLTSNYGDRIKCGVKTSDKEQNSVIVYFEKNGDLISENKFTLKRDKGNKEDVEKVQLFAAVGIRSAGQQLSVRLLDRELWGCSPAKQPSSSSNANALLAAGGSGDQLTPQQTEELTRLLDRELLECPICRDLFTDPRIFPCSVHSFCLGCLQEYVGIKKSVPCPVCRKNITIPPGGPAKLPCNPYLSKLIDLFKASGRK